MKKNSMATTVAIMSVIALFVFGCVQYVNADDSNGPVAAADGSVTLTSNEKIQGDMTVREGSAEGDIYVRNTEVDGDIFVIPEADSKTVHLENTSFHDLVINKAGTIVTLDKESHGDSFYISSPAAAEIGGKIPEVKISSVAGGSNLTITPDAGVDQLVIDGQQTEVTINSSMKKLVVSPGAAGCRLNINAPIETLDLNARVDAAVGANIQTMLLTTGAKGSNVTLANGAVIDNFASEAQMTLGGDGSVNTMYVNSPANIAGGVATGKINVLNHPIERKADGNAINMDPNASPFQMSQPPLPMITQSLEQPENRKEEPSSAAQSTETVAPRQEVTEVPDQPATTVTPAAPEAPVVTPAPTPEPEPAPAPTPEVTPEPVPEPEPEPEPDPVPTPDQAPSNDESDVAPQPTAEVVETGDIADN